MLILWILIYIYICIYIYGILMLILWVLIYIYIWHFNAHFMSIKMPYKLSMQFVYKTKNDLWRFMTYGTRFGSKYPQFHYWRYFSWKQIFLKVTVKKMQLDKALRFMSEGRGFDFPWGDVFFIHNPSGLTMTLLSIKPLTEMSIKDVYWQ